VSTFGVLSCAAGALISCSGLRCVVRHRISLPVQSWGSIDLHANVIAVTNMMGNITAWSAKRWCCHPSSGRSLNVKEVPGEGQPFDPAVHDAIMQVRS
jgi:hypothetical protein